jgi:hypothetical protein
MRESEIAAGERILGKMEGGTRIPVYLGADVRVGSSSCILTVQLIADLFLDLHSRLRWLRVTQDFPRSPVFKQLKMGLLFPKDLMFSGAVFLQS